MTEKEEPHAYDLAVEEPVKILIEGILRSLLNREEESQKDQVVTASKPSQPLLT